jgi:hypothetical protein
LPTGKRNRLWLSWLVSQKSPKYRNVIFPRDCLEWQDWVMFEVLVASGVLDGQAVREKTARIKKETQIKIKRIN